MNKVDDFFFAGNAVSGEYLPMRHAETDTPNRLMASAYMLTYHNADNGYLSTGNSLFQNG